MLIKMCSKYSGITNGLSELQLSIGFLRERGIKFRFAIKIVIHEKKI